jgi:hypothetical protein
MGDSQEILADNRPDLISIWICMTRDSTRRSGLIGLLEISTVETGTTAGMSSHLAT